MSKIKVLKFGGAVIRDKRDIPKVSDVIIQREMNDEDKLVIVVSAMGNTTDDLLDKVKENKDANLAAIDMLLSVGEIETAALLANNLSGRKIKAKSFTGVSARIITDYNFGNANIIHIDTKPILDFLSHGDVAVVTGFQGQTESGDITTLGRNGSDTTAFYLTYYLRADSCTLYKDVNGVYDLDPKVHKSSRLYKNINYKDVLNGGVAGVIHEKALQLCDKMYTERDLEIMVKSFSLSDEFTKISKQKTEFHR